MSGLQDALNYARRGWAVLPTQAKRPLVNGGYGAATTDQATIRAWWHRWPDAEPAIATGMASGLVSLDIDGLDGAASLSQLTQSAPLPETPLLWTGNDTNRQFLFSVSAPTPTRIRALPGLDVLGNKSYVVVPPAVHPTTGRERIWDPCLHPDCTPLAPAPTWLLQLAHRHPPITPLTRDAAEGDGGTLASKYIYLLNPALSLALDEGVAEACMSYLVGGPVRVGQAFCCLLHRPDRHPSAALWRAANGVPYYHDFHLQGGPSEFLLLPVVRAALAYGELRRLSRSELAVWQLRLLVDAGILQPAPVPHRPLPPDVRDSVQRTYEGFLHLVGCRWLHTAGDPAPFTWRFAAAWTGLSQPTIGQAMRVLLKGGYLRQVGRHNKTALFLPTPP